MIEPITINLYGGPGCGKSTTSSAVFALLKMHDINVELITEFAKDLTWEERERTLFNQYYIWGKQYHRMWRIRDKVEVMITDSPLLLSLVYGYDKPQCFKEVVMHSSNDGFDNMNYFLTRNKKFNPNGRSQTEEEAKIVDYDLEKLLRSVGEEYKVVTGDYLGANQIADDILVRLNSNLKIGFYHDGSI